MRKEIPSAGMSAHLGSEPLLHTANLGVEFIIRRMTNEIHPVQVDKGKDREHIRLVEGGTGKRGDLRGGGTHLWCRPTDANPSSCHCEVTEPLGVLCVEALEARRTQKSLFWLRTTTALCDLTRFYRRVGHT